MAGNEDCSKSTGFSFGFSKTKASKQLKDSIIKEKENEETKGPEFVRSLEKNKIER